jgi:hypothetical protein
MATFNYAGPGAVVGVQAGTVITGGIHLTGDAVIIDGLVIADEDDD